MSHSQCGQTTQVMLSEDDLRFAIALLRHRAAQYARHGSNRVHTLEKAP